MILLVLRPCSSLSRCRRSRTEWETVMLTLLGVRVSNAVFGVMEEEEASRRLANS